MSGLLGRLKSFGKQVDDKTKRARAVAEVAVVIGNRGVGPAAKPYLAPTPSPTEYSQQVVRDEEGNWADVDLEHTKRENAKLGRRAADAPQGSPAGRQQPPARSGNTGQTGKSAGTTGHDAGTAKTKTGSPTREQRAQPHTRSQPASTRGQAPHPSHSSNHGGSAGHSSSRPAGR